MVSHQRPFLTANWRNLVVLSYRIDPGVLQPYVPQGLSLDQWRIRKAADSKLECDLGRLYGDRFTESLSGAVISAFWAQGPAVALHQGVTLQ
ncbi:MAG TPA: DUF2071 domain-containing protein [Dehalococcoidia bacterium]|nr:DUF2071 domain-containing protein [Dehalococcoidia bacterium]